MSFLHVVIPVYNALPFLRETVASVLNQPYKEIDIVLVDDGSSDGSGALCDELAAQNERLSVIHQKNAGVSAARNAGIEYFLNQNAQGYLAFLDSDDLWCPNVFTTDYIREITESDADVVGFSMYCSNPSASRFQSLSSYEKKTLEFSKKYQSEFLWAKGSFGTHLYNIRLLRENSIRFVVGCRLNEDVIFSAKMLFCSRKIVFMDRYLYIYRKNRASVTSKNKYNPGNACHIPDAWYDAAAFAKTCKDIPKKELAKWRAFCIDTSAVRCLEMVRYLCETGYSAEEIDILFSEKEYYRRISTLKEEQLALWQRPDLILYQKDSADFCDYYRNKGRKTRLIKKIPFIYQIKDIVDCRRFTLSFDDITQNE